MHGLQRSQSRQRIAQEGDPQPTLTATATSESASTPGTAPVALHVMQSGVQPYNMVEVTLHRDQSGSNMGDDPLDLFFAPVLGHSEANLFGRSVAVMQAGVGFRKVPGQNIAILPITLDVPTWDNLIQNGVGTDNYTYNAVTKTVSSGPDGIKEINLYPEGNVALPPGNRGTVDFGETGNSTADISRQILHGLNDDDFAALADQGITELRWDQGRTKCHQGRTARHSIVYPGLRTGQQRRLHDCPFRRHSHHARAAHRQAVDQARVHSAGSVQRFQRDSWRYGTYQRQHLNLTGSRAVNR